MFVDKQQFTPAELEVKETAFRKIMADVPEAEKLMAELDEFFLGKKLSDIRPVYYWTYWRWFVDVTWEFLNGLRPEKFGGAVATQVPMALLCGRDVWKQIVRYFAFNGYNEIEMPILFADVRDGFMNSEMVVGKWDGNDVTIKQLVTEVQKISRPSASSLERAEFNAKLKKAFMPRSDEQAAHLEIDGDLVIDRFIGLVNFFLGVDPKDAWRMIDALVNPEFYENFEKALQQGVPNTAEQTIPAATTAPATPSPTSIPAPAAKSVAPVQQPAPVAAPAPSLVNFKDIKAVLERKFPRGVDGQFQDPTSVLTMIDDLANRYRDDRIRELYVYNENTGAFEWNNTLLNS